jgi:hypothetical protein
MTDTTYAFVSYAHQDFIIADEIRNQLDNLAQRGMGGSCLECFLDTESIEPGKKYEPVIRKALEQTDWLIVVFTGDQSVYCGFEIGLYSFMNDSGKAQEEKPVVCVHDVDKTRLPAVLTGYNTTQISRVANYLPDNATASSPDVKLWWDSPLGKLLQDVCQSKNLYTPLHRKRDPAQYELDIAKAASKIAHAFEAARAGDEESETPVTAVLELIVYPPFDSAEKRIPENATLVGSSRAFELLGINPPLSLDQAQAPQITWGQLRQTLSRPERANIPWVDKLETNISRAAALKTPEPDDVTFRGKDGRIYRAILTRHKLYKNGKRRFFVLLVESFDRRFVGNQQTSMLLTALTLASRWRFTFFERWRETLKQFSEDRTDKEFQDACKQLEYNMEWMENEGVELGADDPEAMVNAFGFDTKARVERFYTDFYVAKKLMKSQFPHTFEELKPEARPRVQKAIIDFLTTIKEQNAEFLKLCVDKYAERVKCNRPPGGG